jgi:tetratricopeptide (TPR) repeat protein
VLLSFACVWTAAGADLKEAQQMFRTGNYTGCVALAEQSLTNSRDDEDWQLLRSQALMATGRYREALAAITNAIGQDRWSIRLCWQAREVYRANGKTSAANELVNGIMQRVIQHPRDFRDAPSLVVVGQAELLAGVDPKTILDTIFEAARKLDPDLREWHLATGNMALDKHDFALAANKFEDGLKRHPDDPELHFGLARAYAPGDTALMAASIEKALEINSNHVGSLLLLADHAIDAENYSGAADLLDRVEKVNPWDPESWAYRAVLAHLQNQGDKEVAARQMALHFWPSNPATDHLIGLKLSQNYRFVEGAARQRQALQFDPDYLPAKAQLAQDLLRLGDEAEGWQLADEVQKLDGYDAEAFNLATLHDTMAKFVTLTNRDFVLRMGAKEAPVYGAYVLDLLSQARAKLCAKYGFEVKRPTIVEVFPDQKDFAVRTFGMPGNPGYLGVCFGAVITANSPAAHVGNAVNWQAVLWHEFCHVVTLQLTRNKMPRWLSEGISVYEERQANLSWGQIMSPRYREMVLGDELTPVSQLSGAFLSPPSDLHLQFAYYESSLVVEFIVSKYGADALKGILRDLGEGGAINPTIEKHTAPMASLEKDFDRFARARAEALGPGLSWETPPDENGRTAHATRPPARRRESGGTNSTTHLPTAGGVKETWDEWATAHPTNFWVLTRQLQQLAQNHQWPEARDAARKMVTLYPDSRGQESAYRTLATALRALGETNAERQVLARYAGQDDDATDAYHRLMELAAAKQDWPDLRTNAQRYLAVDPLIPMPHRYLAQSAEATGDTQTAINGYRAVLFLDPPDPAEAHYDLARVLHRAGDPGARRQVLQALEEAPRYRAALQLLLDINHEPATTNSAATPRADSRVTR